MTQTAAAVAEIAPDSVTDSATDTVAEYGTMHPALRSMVLNMAAEVREASGEAADEFVLDLMNDILQADTFDAIFAAQEKGTVSGQDFTMRPFTLREENISYRKSSKGVNTGGFPFYALMKVTDMQTGDELSVNCGGKTFMAVLYALQTKGYFAEAPEGRSFMLKATESGEGAYLSLLPFAGAAKPAAKTNVKK